MCTNKYNMHSEADQKRQGYIYRDIEECRSECRINLMPHNTNTCIKICLCVHNHTHSDAHLNEISLEREKIQHKSLKNGNKKQIRYSL